ncbi:hypothetical protein JQ581_31610 [Bradyrhizobium liaoningense]|nr:hypothetical protein [Bradyrhizobium liaoningense]
MNVGFDAPGNTPAFGHHRGEPGSPARTPSAAGFLVLDCGIGRWPRVAATHLLDTRRGSADRRAAVRTIAGRARANVPARGAKAIGRAAAVSGDTEIGFAPETIAPDGRDLPRIFFKGGTMTAYLISLALAGLVAIVLWETCS